MRTTLLVALSFFAVAFAGCTDEPPSGEISGSSTSVPVEGEADTEETTFDDPTPDELMQEGQTCPQRDGENVPADQKCTYPSTVTRIHMMSLPDPNGGTYSAEFYSDASANSMAIGPLNVNGTGAEAMYDVTFNNQADCAGQTTDEGCVMSLQFDQVRVLLGDLVVAVAPLSGNFEANPDFAGHSFTIDYSGSTGTLTLNGAASNLTYELVLYEADETGATTPVQTIGVSAGESEVTADRNFNEYAEAHIHVTGTKVNVAQATVG